MSKAVLTVLIAGVLVVVVTGMRFLLKAPSVKRPLIAGKTLGDPQAPVKIIEFTDFQCPACAKASVFVHEETKKEGSGIFLELKHFPLVMHKNAMRAAVVAECALPQGKFWPMQGLLFESQKNWEKLEDPGDYFLSLARSIGLEDVPMLRCMSDPAVEWKVRADLDEGKSLGIQATPTFFVNGKMAVGLAALQTALKEMVH